MFLGEDVKNVQKVGRELYRKYQKNNFDVELVGGMFFIKGDCTDRQLRELDTYLWKNYGVLSGVNFGGDR